MFRRLYGVFRTLKPPWSNHPTPLKKIDCSEFLTAKHGFFRPNIRGIL